MGRRQQIAGLAADHLHRPAAQTPRQARLIAPQRVGGGGGEVRQRIRADGDGQGHGLSLGHVVFLEHLTQVARGPRKAGQVVRVVDHEPVHAPVDPAAVHVLRDHQVPGAQVAPAVALVKHGRGQVEQVGIGARADHFLARRFLDLHRVDGVAFPLLVGFVDLPHRGGGREPQGDGDAAPGGHRIDEDRDLVHIVRDTLEPNRRPVLLARKPADGAELKVPAHLLLHLHEVAGASERLDKAAIVVENHGLKRKVRVLRLQARTRAGRDRCGSLQPSTSSRDPAHRRAGWKPVPTGFQPTS